MSIDFALRQIDAFTLVRGIASLSDFDLFAAGTKTRFRSEEYAAGIRIRMEGRKFADSAVVRLYRAYQARAGMFWPKSDGFLR
jgi:hypothetical protein